MAAPAWASTGAYLEGDGATASFAVPSGVAMAGDIIVIPIYLDAALTITAYPAGFAEAEGSPVAITGGGSHSLHMVWKRANVGDLGTYDFTLSATGYRAGAALRYTGCVASGTPWDTPTATGKNTINNTVSPAVSITTAGPDRMDVWAATNWTGGRWTPPAGYTERVDQGFGSVTLADAVQATAGSSGTVTGTCAGTDKGTAWLGALIGTTAGGGAPAAPIYAVSQYGSFH